MWNVPGFNLIQTIFRNHHTLWLIIYKPIQPIQKIVNMSIININMAALSDILVEMNMMLFTYVLRYDIIHHVAIAFDKD